MQEFVNKESSGVRTQKLNKNNEELLNAVYNVYPTVVKTGQTISFDDGANDVPVLSLKVNISFEQAGSGVPSIENVRLISGKNNVSVMHSGENASDYSTVTVQISDADGTVYGGSLDLISGDLTITHKFRQFNGQENWLLTFTNTLPAFLLYLTQNANAVNNNGTFSHFAYGNVFESSGYGARIYTYNNTTRLLIRFEGQPQNTESFKSLLALWASNGTPLQCVYEYLTPIIYHLAPHELRTLLGVNNLWTDGDDLVIKYRADIGKYVDNLIQ